MSAAAVLSEEVCGVLAEADQLMVGVITAAGPHVTPELFTVADGRVWCLTAASTLKARLLADGGPVAIAAVAVGRGMVAVGHAVVMDPARPLRNLRHPDVAVSAPRAVGDFAVRNAAELSGAVVDLLTGKLGGPIPDRRVILSIEPRGAVFTDGGNVVGSFGSDTTRGDRDSGGSDRAELDLLDDVPDGLRQLASDGRAFLGWTTTTGGPLVLPAAWDAEASQATVSAELLSATDGAVSSPACVTRDAWTNFGPSGKQGLMLRGRGVANINSATAVVDLDVDAVAYWDGIRTGRSTHRE